ncbi:MAG TPA: glycine oxidase ThiO [Polyangia bacterium]|nr:glycine oxidase ThiO [Polyangia bacterium]
MAWDAVVIGGGVMGCAVAHRLARRGLRRVAVLERSIPGAEASSAAGGILGAQAESAAGGAFLDLALKSRAAWPAYAEELHAATGVDIQYWPCGLLQLALDAQQARQLEQALAWQRASGLRAQALSGAEVRALEPAVTDSVRAGLLLPDDGQVEPRALMRALQLAAAAAGVEFRTGYVKRVVQSGGRARGVELDSELMEAGAVVLAAGSWSGLVDGCALPARAVRPVRGQMVQLETRPPIARHVLLLGHGYVIVRRDGRVLCGSTMEQVGFQKEVTAGGLRSILDLALAIVPALADAPVSGFWSNFRPYTEDQLPVLGGTPVEGLFLATGHFRNGILLAPITAEIVADCIVDGRARLDLTPFRVERFGA